MQAGTLGGVDRFFAVGSDVATQLASYEDPSASDRKVWKIAGYVVLALTAILILVTLVMVRRIKVSRLPVCRACASCAGLPWLHAGLQRAEQPDAEQLLVRMQVAVACIKVASQAVSCMPSILFFPILPFLMVVCLVIYWICVAGYLYSAGTITPTYKDTSSATLLSISVSLRRLLHAMRRSGCDYSIFLTSPVPCQNHCQGGKVAPCRHCSTTPAAQHPLPRHLQPPTQPQTSQMPSVPTTPTATMPSTGTRSWSTCSYTTSLVCCGPTSSSLALGEACCHVMSGPFMQSPTATSSQLLQHTASPCC